MRNIFQTGFVFEIIHLVGTLEKLLLKIKILASTKFCEYREFKVDCENNYP